MNDNTAILSTLTRPAYVLDEQRLRHNLMLISNVAQRADIEIILAFKAYALWRTFPIFKEYISATTASSLYEARLAFEEFGAPAHTYSPAYTSHEIGEISRCSSHLTFNSLTQFTNHHEEALRANPTLSLGLRVNPEYSEIETELYNPCAPGSRFGVLASQLPLQLPDAVDGFHCHCHCESGSDVFERTLTHFEEQFSKWLPQLRWVNFGGGHLMTRRDYDLERLVRLMQGFHERHPWLKVILEPGSAFGWQTGELVAHVLDIVENHGIRTAILDVSFTCHMPDCLEMPYMPQVRGAEIVDNATTNSAEDFIYRLGGCSCLSGDYLGFWHFNHALEVGETIIFEDMLHYTTVKTTMFNGISHPDIQLLRTDGTLQLLRRYEYEDYRDRMD